MSGYLGSGKTTLLRRILTEETEIKTAVIVNDMSEINIDGYILKGDAFSRTDEKLVEMQNGCICCTLREDLLIEVSKLAALKEIDHIVIESSGISEPVPVAQTLCFADEELNIDLTQLCYINSMVTVVDANRFWHDYYSGESLLDRKEAADENDTRDIADLLIEQIEFANTIILNKVDLVDDSEVKKLHAAVSALNPEADILQSSFSSVDTKELLHRNHFDLEKASGSAGWIKELNEEHTPETEEYGIRSFVYRRKRPFHPKRLLNWLENWPDTVIRAKGFFWLATRNDTAGLLSQAGTSIILQGAGNWIASMSEEEKEEAFAEDPVLTERWDSVFGDRITELVFIGTFLVNTNIEASLDDCLLTEEEMSADWTLFQDDLPPFQ
nr:GTP-binding protein [Metabacillus lacus]